MTGSSTKQSYLIFLLVYTLGYMLVKFIGEREGRGGFSISLKKGTTGGRRGLVILGGHWS